MYRTDATYERLFKQPLSAFGTIGCNANHINAGRELLLEAVAVG
jgi:hypothetical protein